MIASNFTKTDHLMPRLLSGSNLAIKIDDLLIDIEKENPALENVLPKIYSNSNLPNFDA